MSGLNVILLLLASILAVGRAAPTAAASDTPYIDVSQIIKNLGPKGVANIIKTFGQVLSPNDAGPDFPTILEHIADVFDAVTPTLNIPESRAPGVLDSFNFVDLLKGAGSVFDRVARNYFNRTAHERSLDFSGRRARMEEINYSKVGDVLTKLIKTFTGDAGQKEVDVDYGDVASLLQEFLNFIFSTQPRLADTKIAEKTDLDSFLELANVLQT